MFLDYLKPEFRNTKEATEIQMLFQKLNSKWRMVLRVPVDEGDRVTRFIKQAIKPQFAFHRRTGGGPRYDGQALTCLRKDATFFKYYFNSKDGSVQDFNVPAVHGGINGYCKQCGNKL